MKFKFSRPPSILFFDRSNHFKDDNCEKDVGIAPMMELFAIPRDFKGDAKSRSKSGRTDSAMGLSLTTIISAQGIVNKQEGIEDEGSCEPGSMLINVILLTIACVMSHRSLSGRSSVMLVFNFGQRNFFFNLA